MAEIVKLLGNETLPGEPDEGIITTLESLLVNARSGDLRAFAYATVRQNNAVGTGWDGTAGTRYTLGAVIGMLDTRYHSELLQGGTCDG